MKTLTLALILLSACCPKPKPQIPQVVISEEPCMEYPPEIDDLYVPKNDDKTVPVKEYNRAVKNVLIMADYITEQYKRCGVK